MASPLSIDLLIGGNVIASAFVFSLFGLSLAQAYIYWLNSSRDRFYLKATVWTVMLLETVHTIAVVHFMYHYTVTSFGKVLMLAFISWSSIACIFLNLGIVFIVQSFYLMRLWILSKSNKLLLITLSFVQLIRLALGIATGVLACKLKTWLRFRTEIGPRSTVTAGLSFAALTDLLISAALIYYLLRSRTGYKKTDHIVQRLMIFSVNTGLITMVCSIAVILSFAFVNNSLLFAGLYSAASKLYSNSLFGTLNARQQLRKSDSNDSEPAELKIRSTEPTPIEISRQMVKVVHTDSRSEIEKTTY